MATIEAKPKPETIRGVEILLAADVDVPTRVADAISDVLRGRARFIERTRRRDKTDIQHAQRIAGAAR